MGGAMGQVTGTIDHSVDEFSLSSTSHRTTGRWSPVVAALKRCLSARTGPQSSEKSAIGSPGTQRGKEPPSPIVTRQTR
jgi:hypothetical protein